MQKIKLFGIEIGNYTVREAMLKVDQFLNNDTLNTIEHITTNTLVKAEEKPEVKKCIEQLDLAIISEKGILTVAGITSTQQLNETREAAFFKEFMRRIVRNQKRVFLLANDEQKLEKFQEYLSERYDRIQIVGSFTVEDNTDAVINEMNIVVPDIVLSILPVPMQEEFLLANKEKMNANLWYGIGEEYAHYMKSGYISQSIMHMVHKVRLLWRNSQYKKE
ncbi:MAG: WecB/TagA/CpsF family glycosyltransferase [Lachnospiraceae bacterium]